MTSSWRHLVPAVGRWRWDAEVRLQSVSVVLSTTLTADCWPQSPVRCHQRWVGFEARIFKAKAKVKASGSRGQGLPCLSSQRSIPHHYGTWMTLFIGSCHMEVGLLLCLAGPQNSPESSKMTFRPSLPCHNPSERHWRLWGYRPVLSYSQWVCRCHRHTQAISPVSHNGGHLNSPLSCWTFPTFLTHDAAAACCGPYPHHDPNSVEIKYRLVQGRPKKLTPLQLPQYDAIIINCRTPVPTFAIFYSHI